MFTQPASRSIRPFSRTQSIARQIRERELMALCVIRFDENERKPSLHRIACRCKEALSADLNPEFEVVFVGLDQDLSSHIMEWSAHHHLHTLADWSRALQTILAPASDNCPNCGLATFADAETVPVFCSACGANPARVFETSGGVLSALSV